MTVANILTRKGGTGAIRRRDSKLWSGGGRVSQVQRWEYRKSQLCRSLLHPFGHVSLLLGLLADSNFLRSPFDFSL